MADETARNALQFALFLGLLLVGLLPFFLMAYRSGSFRERLRDVVACLDCRGLCERRVHYDEADLRTLRELEEPPERPSVGINGAYRMYQARRSRLSLRLASWREDVKKSVQQDDLHHKLAQIQAAQFSHRQVTTRPATATAPTAAAAAAVPFDIRVVSVNDEADYHAMPESPRRTLSDEEEEEEKEEVV